MVQTRLRTPLEAEIIEKIRRSGPITYCEFIEACLYHRQHGYYMKQREEAADFYTSAELHPVFGRLMASQLAEMWTILGSPDPFSIMEAGSGNGRLAEAILAWLSRKRPEIYRVARYVSVEPSPAARAEQEKQLGEHLAAGRMVMESRMPAGPVAGCVLSNELVDSFPVHVVAQEAGRMQEVFVSTRDGELAETVSEPSSSALGEYFSRFGIQLAEGQRAEADLCALAWMADVGQRLERGFVLTIDYGYLANQLFDERHFSGTLMAYRQHRAHGRLLESPGEQDLTHHVNFTALIEAGRENGLELAGLASQMQFLMALGRGNEFADLYDEGQSETDRYRARLQLKTLIYPEGMGETFRVLIQQKGLVPQSLSGLAGI
ncbi:MAG TPA: SAM-dependent methyltransferase [Candidatus Acidoferrales bacterium]